jgi:parallel beta-helix repeat protein
MLIFAAVAAGSAGAAVPTRSLKLWLKADNGIRLKGGRVTQWADQSGSGAHASQKTSSNQPALLSNAVNGQPAVRFDGSSDFMSFSLPLNGLSGLTLVLVSAAAQDTDGGANGASSAPLFWNETASWGAVHLSPFPRVVKYRFGTGQSGNLPAYTRPAAAFNRFTITTAVKNGTNEWLYVDGAQVLAQSGKLGAVANVSSTGYLGRGVNGSYFQGDIAEVLVYTAALTDAERQELDQYLTAKYFGAPPAPPPVNQAPTASAGPDQTITQPGSATLSGSASDDGLPSGSLSTTWSQVSGPGTATFLNASAAATSATFSAAGSYVLRLTASDGALAASDEVGVTVNPQQGSSPTIPTQNLSLWLQADAGVTLNGSTVAQWADQSSSGTHAAQPTALNQPALLTNAVNGKPALRFDGVNDYLSFTLPVNGLSGLTMILVSASLLDVDGGWNGVANAPLFWNETASWGTLHLSPFQRMVKYRFGTGQASNLPAHTRPVTLNAAYSLTTAVKSASTESLYVNGMQVLAQSGKLTALANIRDTGNLGRGYNDDTFFNGDIAEVLVYTRALTDAERQQVEQYLLSKYGIAPPVNQPPSASAGPDQTITLPSSAALSGSANDDGLPSGSLSTGWSQVGGPGTVTFANPAALSTTASFSAAGSYVLRLTASDGALSGSDDISVTVNPSSSGSAPPGSIVLNPGDSLQAAVNANPEGATFYLRAGVYRMQSVQPKNGSTFLGETGAVLNGSRLLTSFTREGSYWVASGQTQQGWFSNESCKSGYTRCSYPEDLYLDDSPLRHVGTLGEVGAGKWYFDYGADKIYFWDDPSGRKVETSVTQQAFWGPGARVTIKNLVIEKYATPALLGVVAGGNTSGPVTTATDWVVDSNDLRLNHGGGLGPGHRWQILRNKIHHNGQIGISGGGDDVLVEGNEIYNNNYAQYQPAWEAGGTKFSKTRNLVVRGNNVHHNDGPGLWTDIDNIYVLIENNLVADNLGEGIFHEISYDAVIRNNTVRRNGTVNPGWLYGANILISASRNTEVYGNVVEVSSSGGNGICLIYQDRGSGAYGPHVTTDNYVHNNTVTYLGNTGASGAAADFNPDSLWNGNNRFNYNTYHAPRVDLARWAWRGEKNWSQFQAAGQDTGGTADTNVTPGP